MDTPTKPPSPEIVAALNWFVQNLWVTGMALLFSLGKIVFGDVKKDVAEVERKLERQDEKIDAIAESLNQLYREFSEFRGELKGKGRSTK